MEMNYRHDWSMANINNVVVALNKGGVLSCNDLMERLWEDATQRQRDRKINASRILDNRTVEYARKQIRQEVRRSLYTHFNDPDQLGLHIFRATPLGSAEVFWVVEEQTMPVPETIEPTVEVEVVQNPTADELAEAFTPVDDEEETTLSEDASLIERLTAANGSDIRTSKLLKDSVSNNFINPDMPSSLCSALTEELSDFNGLPNNSQTAKALSDRLEEVVDLLVKAGE